MSKTKRKPTPKVGVPTKADAHTQVDVPQKRRSIINIDDDYLGEPYQEEVVGEFKIGSRVLATITRNRYGALVLNTNHVMFIDVDLLLPANQFVESHEMNQRLTSANRSPAVQRLNRMELLTRFDEVAQANPELGFRVYRTAAGYRLLLTDREYNAAEPETGRLFEALGADPAYAELCQKQQCFRARVSPKPWRVGMQTRLRDAENQRAWVYRYEIQAADFAVCEFVASHGNPQIEDTLQTIIELHDRLTIQEGAMLA